MYNETATTSVGLSAAKQTPVAAANSAFEHAIGLSSRVQDLVSRLAGPVPEADLKAEAHSGNGMLPCLQDYADVTRFRIQEAHNALDRLERML